MTALLGGLLPPPLLQLDLSVLEATDGSEGLQLFQQHQDDIK